MTCDFRPSRRQGLAGLAGMTMSALAAPVMGQDVLQGVRRGSYRSHGRDLAVLVATPTVQDGPMQGAAIVLLHGGGGIRRDFGNYYGNARRLAALGYLVAMPDYFGDADGGRVANNPDWWREAVIDATAWVASRPGVNPERIGAMGYSRGGYLAGEVAVQETAIKAVVGVCSAGNVDVGDMIRKPAFLLIHAENDPVVPPVRTRRWANALERADIPVETIVYPGRRHGFQEAEWTEIFNSADAFYRRTLIPTET